MKFIATFALLISASSQVRIQDTHELPPATELIQALTQLSEHEETKSLEKINAENLAKLEMRVDNMEQEMWGLWNKAAAIVKANPHVAEALKNPLVQKALENEHV